MFEPAATQLDAPRQATPKRLPKMEAVVEICPEDPLTLAMTGWCARFFALTTQPAARQDPSAEHDTLCNAAPEIAAQPLPE